MYKGLEKEFRFTNNAEYELWFCPNNIKHCMSGNEKKYMLNLPIALNMWQVQIGNNLSREEVLALEDKFQL